MPETPIYAHMANDGLPFCSYDLDFEIVDDLDSPRQIPTVEYVEMQFYEEDWADDVLDELPQEGRREDEPPRVGTLIYEDGELQNLEFEKPDQAALPA